MNSASWESRVEYLLDTLPLRNWKPASDWDSPGDPEDWTQDPETVVLNALIAATLAEILIEMVPPESLATYTAACAADDHHYWMVEPLSSARVAVADRNAGFEVSDSSRRLSSDSAHCIGAFALLAFPDLADLADPDGFAALENALTEQKVRSPVLANAARRIAKNRHRAPVKPTTDEFDHRWMLRTIFAGYVEYKHNRAIWDGDKTQGPGLN